jgi:hypothetical protein
MANSSTYYTLFVFNKDTGHWEDVFGSYVRAEVVEESQEYYGERKKIMKNDGTLVGLRHNYAALGQPLSGLQPTNGAVVLHAHPFPHEADGHLWTVMCHFNDQYVVWSHNEQDGGCYQGQYFDTWTAAYDAWFKRYSKLEQRRIDALAALGAAQ